jgi:hypothetical protein
MARVTGRLDRSRQLVRQLRQIGGQACEVVQGHRGKGRSAALVELVQAEPAHGGMPLKGPQDDVAVVVLTFAFAPISLFFLITARSYAFFKLLNVGILALTALIGLRFLISGMRALNEHVVAESMLSNQVVVPAALPEREMVSATVGGADSAPQPPTNGAGSRNPKNRPEPAPGGAKARAPQPAPGDRPASMLLLYIWILLFGFVGTQLAWTLRPFFGDPDQPFALFRDIDGTFYSDILSTLGSLLG